MARVIPLPLLSLLTGDELEVPWLWCVVALLWWCVDYCPIRGHVSWGCMLLGVGMRAAGRFASVCLFACLAVCLFVCLSVLPVCMCVSACMLFRARSCYMGISIKSGLLGEL